MISILFVKIYSLFLSQNGPRYGGHNRLSSAIASVSSTVSTAPATLPSVFSSLISVSPTLPTVSATLRSVAASLPTILPIIRSVPATLRSVPASLPSVSLKLRSRKPHNCSILRLPGGKSAGKQSFDHGFERLPVQYAGLPDGQTGLHGSLYSPGPRESVLVRIISVQIVFAAPVRRLLSRRLARPVTSFLAASFS